MDSQSYPFESVSLSRGSYVNLVPSGDTYRLQKKDSRFGCDNIERTLLIGDPLDGTLVIQFRDCIALSNLKSKKFVV